jgi:hypothetical protein
MPNLPPLIHSTAYGHHLKKYGEAAASATSVMVTCMVCRKYLERLLPKPLLSGKVHLKGSRCTLGHDVQTTGDPIKVTCNNCIQTILAKSVKPHLTHWHECKCISNMKTHDPYKVDCDNCLDFMLKHQIIVEKVIEQAHTTVSLRQALNTELKQRLFARPSRGLE